MGELLDLQWIFLFDLAENGGDGGGPFFGILLLDARADQLFVHFGSQSLGARTLEFTQGIFKMFGGPPGSLEALRRYPQPLRTTDDGGFRSPEIIPVEIGRRIGGEQMQLDEGSHKVTPCGLWNKGLTESGLGSRLIVNTSVITE